MIYNIERLYVYVEPFYIISHIFFQHISKDVDIREKGSACTTGVYNVYGTFSIQGTLFFQYVPNGFHMTIDL